MDLQSAFLASVWTIAIIWAAAGYGIVTYLLEIPKPGWATLLLIMLGGPVCWALALYRGLQTLRERIMARFGVAGYRCCGGQTKCRHNPQRSIDRLTNQ